MSRHLGADDVRRDSAEEIARDHAQAEARRVRDANLATIRARAARAESGATLPPLEAVLDVEARFPTMTGAKETHLRATYNLSPTQYHQHLAKLVRDPTAMKSYPLEVATIRDRLDAARVRRAARTFHRT